MVGAASLCKRTLGLVLPFLFLFSVEHEYERAEQRKEKKKKCPLHEFGHKE